MARITSIQLERAIEDYFGQHNQCPQPFVWTKDADLILRKVQKMAEHLVPTENWKRTSDSGHYYPGPNVSHTNPKRKRGPPSLTLRVGENLSGRGNSGVGLVDFALSPGIPSSGSVLLPF